MIIFIKKKKKKKNEKNKQNEIWKNGKKKRKDSRLDEGMNG